MRKMFVLGLGIAISAVLAADAWAQSSSQGNQSDPPGVQIHQRDRDQTSRPEDIPPQVNRTADAPLGTATMLREQKRLQYQAAKEATIAAYEAKKAAAREQLQARKRQRVQDPQVVDGTVVKLQTQAQIRKQLWQQQQAQLQQMLQAQLQQKLQAQAQQKLQAQTQRQTRAGK